MMRTFRIHGDNVIECERISNIIINALSQPIVKYSLTSPSVIVIEINAIYLCNKIEWRLELLPGFNKGNKKRWNGNIFSSLKAAGSFLDETPDAIITKTDENKLTETVLLGIEFCSALQAGNQAWQRSARALSTGRTGCPYIYIVDFVKYELDNKTRKRKNLRFPNPAVPYSYISFAKNTNNFIAQLYVKSEEFNKSKEKSLESFNEENFGSIDLGDYIIKLLLGINTDKEQQAISRKNMNVVHFLSSHFYTKNKTKNISPQDWEKLYSESEDIIDFSVHNTKFSFTKNIAQKSVHGKSEELVNLVDRLSVGLSSKDLPIGIIPNNRRKQFANCLAEIYPFIDQETLNILSKDEKHLLVSIFKGFKPAGDDNRPDRGLLPLAAMLSKENVDILSFIYGPLLAKNLKLLDTNPEQLAMQNGFWKSILSISDFVLLDVPVIKGNINDVFRLYNTSSIKDRYFRKPATITISETPVFSNIPTKYGEDDVDTAIHYLFKHVLNKYCFEGMCNPPGGDWSGFSVIDDNYEYRWLSLPRESDSIDGKRPDHIIEIFNESDMPILLSIESKEKSADLELEVGLKLIRYIEKLMDYIPSAKRKYTPSHSEWQWGDNKVDFNHYTTISAAAYLKDYAESPSLVFKKQCELLFVMQPQCDTNKIGWEIEIFTSSSRSEQLKKFIIEKHRESQDTFFTIK